MSFVSFGCTGKKSLFPTAVAVFIVIVSCCVPCSTYLLTQGLPGASFDLIQEGPRPVPIGTLTAGNGPSSSSVPETEGLPASSVPETEGLPAEPENLTEPTVPVIFINVRMRNRTSFISADRLLNVGSMFTLPRIFGKTYFSISENLFPSAFYCIKTVRKLE